MARDALHGEQGDAYDASCGECGRNYIALAYRLRDNDEARYEALALAAGQGLNFVIETGTDIFICACGWATKATSPEYN